MTLPCEATCLVLGQSVADGFKRASATLSLRACFDAIKAFRYVSLMHQRDDIMCKAEMGKCHSFQVLVKRGVLEFKLDQCWSFAPGK